MASTSCGRTSEVSRTPSRTRSSRVPTFVLTKRTTPAAVCNGFNESIILFCVQTFGDSFLCVSTPIFLQPNTNFFWWAHDVLKGNLENNMFQNLQDLHTFATLESQEVTNKSSIKFLHFFCCPLRVSGTAESLH